VGELKHKILKTTFHGLAQNEIIIGRRFVKPVANYKLIQFSDNYLFSSYVENYNSNSNNNFKLSFDTWKFGFGFRKGFAYRIGEFAIMPYYHMGLAWNKMNLSLPREGNQFIPENELLFLRNYEDQIKFGTANIAGLDLRISSVIGIGASYEMGVIFPYHKFWQQFGSFFIETFSQTGLDYLTEGVLIKAMPEITPFLYFMLKNGLSYYFYTLKQEDMNWPFTSTSPVTQETIKFSLKITL
jgi:hypothetical protein